jgi:adenylate cyclase
MAGGTLVTLVAAGLYNYATEGRQKRYLKSAFKQYLSPAVIEQLIAHPERLRLGGERRDLSIFFSDLQGFTSLSEALTPEELTSVLNEYLSAMTDIIQEHGGTIDKYEGDAIIAFWNAPIDQPDHAIRAVRSALDCQEELARMRPALRARVGRDLYMRIGLNTGPAVVGNMGSRTRFDYTMLGDAVNLAARLEGVNKQFRTYTMVSRATLERLEGAFPARELSRIAVVGRKEPVTVYEPMTRETYTERKPILEVFARGLGAYYAGKLGEAERIFRGIEAQDPAAVAYADRCRDLSASPPAEPWTGVWVMTSK